MAGLTGLARHHAHTGRGKEKTGDRAPEAGNPAGIAADFAALAPPGVPPDRHVWAWVSAETQSVAAQLHQILAYCREKRLYPPPGNVRAAGAGEAGGAGGAAESGEAVAGTVPWRGRAFAEVLGGCKRGSVVVVPELSRLARNVPEIQALVAECEGRGIVIRDPAPAGSCPGPPG
jgi:hypothetical protein